MNSFPIQSIRDNCPSSKDYLFFNSAGSSLPSKTSMDIQMDYMKKESELGGYKLMELEYPAFEMFYSETAKLINAKPQNIAFSFSATLAFSQALYTIDWKENDLIVTSQLEYVSNMSSILNLQKRYGLRVEYVDTDNDGLIDLNALENMLKSYDVKAIILTHIPTNTGVVQNAEGAGSLCKKYNCIYILDACQSLGQIDVDVEKIQCHFMSVTGRKFLRGPRGTGFLYVNDEFVHSTASPICYDLAGANWKSPTEFTFHKNARRWEMWEKNYSNLLGLTQSIKEINDIGIKQIEAYNQDLQYYYRKVLSTIKGVELYDKGEHLCNIITWRHKDLSKEKTIQLLNESAVIYSLAMKESALIDMKTKGIDWAVRFSPHYFNTKEEIDLFKKRFEEKIS